MEMHSAQNLGSSGTHPPIVLGPHCDVTVALFCNHGYVTTTDLLFEKGIIKLLVISVFTRIPTTISTKNKWI